MKADRIQGDLGQIEVGSVANEPFGIERVDHDDHLCERWRIFWGGYHGGCVFGREAVVVEVARRLLVSLLLDELRRHRDSEKNALGQRITHR